MLKVALMARLKNSTFQGVEVTDVDIDKPTYTRVLEESQADLALIYDKLTGSNAEANTIVHDGAGRGALLGIPMMCISNPDDNVTLPSLPGSASEIYPVSLAFRLPRGESKISLWWRGIVGGEVAGVVGKFYLWTLSGTYIGGTDVSFPDDDLTMARGEIEIDSTLYDGAECLALFRIEAFPGQLYRSGDAFIGFPRQRSGAGWSYEQGTDDVITVRTPASAMNFAEIDGIKIDDEEGIDAHKLAAIDGNVCVLAEYMLGVPAGGDATFTHADSSSTNPSTSRFFAHTRANFASEPEVDFPLIADCLGPFVSKGASFGSLPVGGTVSCVDAAEPPTTGLTQHYPPWVKSGALSATYATLWQAAAMMPDFQTSSSRLVCRLLILKRLAGYGATWTFRATTSAGNATSSLITDVPGSAMSYVEITGIPFTPDAINTLKIEAVKNAARNVQEFSLLSVCWQFER